MFTDPIVPDTLPTSWRRSHRGGVSVSAQRGGVWGGMYLERCGLRIAATFSCNTSKPVVP